MPKVDLNNDILAYIDQINKYYFKGMKSRQTIIHYLALFFEEERKKAETHKITKTIQKSKKKYWRKNTGRRILPF